MKFTRRQATRICSGKDGSSIGRTPLVAIVLLSLALTGSSAVATQAKSDSIKSTAPSLVGSGSASPMSGEQIKWQVVAGGGGAGSSTSYKMSATVGQTATGPASSTSYKVNQGFWQNFSSGSCCVGVTGNVNMAGSVDLADLSALVSYLTGGGYVLTCIPEANVNGAGAVDLADLSALVSYLTGGGYVLPSCP